MKRAKLLVVCVVAVIGVGAIASASASASLPEYRFCVKTKPAKTGEYTESLCATHAGTPGTGAWELESWENGVTRTFAGNIGISEHTAFIPENEAEPWRGGTAVGTLTCKSGSTDGEITGAKQSTETIEFSTCTTEGKKCTSAGQKAGVIVSNSLVGELGYIEEGVVGTRLSAAVGTTIAAYTCEGSEVVLGGSVIGVNTANVKKASKEATLTYNQNAKSGQEVVFGEFPAGGGPFYLTSLLTPPVVTLPEGLKMTVVNKEKGSALEIDA
jgi:hypothetical protein